MDQLHYNLGESFIKKKQTLKGYNLKMILKVFRELCKEGPKEKRPDKDTIRT